MTFWDVVAVTETEATGHFVLLFFSLDLSQHLIFHEGYSGLLTPAANSLPPAGNWVESLIRRQVWLPALTGGATSKIQTERGGVACAAAGPGAFWEATVPLLITRVTGGYQAILSLERHSASLTTYTHSSRMHTNTHTHPYLTSLSAPKRGAHALTPFIEYEI